MMGGVLFRRASSWEDDNGDEPELRVDDALEEIPEGANDARRMMVEAAVIDRNL